MTLDIDKELFQLKVQLTNEFLRNGGLPQIDNIQLLDDIINFKPNEIKTHTPRLLTFFEYVYAINITPPTATAENMNEYISFLQKELFFDQDYIETEEQVDKLFERFENSKDYIFRGQREASWRLYNTLQREWILGKHHGKQNYEELLSAMVEKGRTDCQEEIKRSLGKDHVDTTNDIAVIGYLQHHGCPSPFIDWTSSFLNAMYFAIDGVVENTVVKEIGDYVSLYWLDKKYIEPAGAGSLSDNALTKIGEDYKLAVIDIVAESKEQKDEMIEHFKDRNMIDRNRIEGSGMVSNVWSVKNLMSIPNKIMYFGENEEYEGIVFSLLNSDNIKNQRGVFVFNSDPYKPMEVIALEAYEQDFDNTDKIYRFCSCYNIKKELVPYIKQKLEKSGISKEAIYPDEGITTKPIFQTCLDELSVPKDEKS